MVFFKSLKFPLNSFEVLYTQFLFSVNVNTFVPLKKIFKFFNQNK